ncbi:MAG: hypothetical protein P1T08_17715 [Acidimicrobiia bacterium]|nr:hypothetical protein [Acidimicrobiia bacterium]
MATTPQAPGGARLTDSLSEVVGSAAAEAGTTPEPGPSPLASEVRPDEPIGRSTAFDARVEEVRWLFGSTARSLFSPLVGSIRRRLGLAPQSSGALALAGSLGVGIRLGLALLVTALVGQWTDIPWGRWTAIVVFSGLFDAMKLLASPPVDVEPRPWIRQLGENMTPLLPTIVRESDLEDLAAAMRRWSRPSVMVACGVAVATLMLGAGWLFAPTGMDELPAGSVVLLALLLYEFGALMVFGDFFEWAFAARQARYHHDLFWPSPADSPEVRTAMQMWNVRALAWWITVYLVLMLVLVSWDSPVVVPLAVGFIVIGYLTTIGAAFGDRASVRKIVERTRQQQLEELRQLIKPFKSRYTDLSTQESEQLRDLLFLHDRIRDAPATTSTTRTLLRAVAGLIVPTIVFVITVFGEVSAERLLDAILP